MLGYDYNKELAVGTLGILIRPSITLVPGAIFGGWATPTEAAGVGGLGALLLAWMNGTLNRAAIKDVIERTGLTNAMVFFIVFGATLFSFVFRSLGGDHLMVELLAAMGITSGWEILTFMPLLSFLVGFFSSGWRSR
jgi:TRAP-type mannitol/chloroaromatic compound transport system permease large subunit